MGKGMEVKIGIVGKIEILTRVSLEIGNIFETPVELEHSTN